MDKIKISKKEYDRQYYLKHRQKILNKRRKRYLEKVEKRERRLLKSMKRMGLIDSGIKNWTIHFD